MTNFENIKAMDIDELSEVLYSGVDKICFENCTRLTGNKFECPIKNDTSPEQCKACAKQWLESEVAE